VKLPKEITHKRKLTDCDDLLDAFIAETSELGQKLGTYVVQLAPSHAFDPNIASAFLKLLRARYKGGLACEARHASWFTAEASEILEEYSTTRVGADPPLFAGGEISEPYGGFFYYRWHGAPRTYYSAYDAARLKEFAAIVRDTSAGEAWCIFDNTASGAALPNALDLFELLAGSV
jgi:uncharacterized protein YecE (DUF72 family)